MFFSFIGDLAGGALRQKMRLNDVTALTVPDQSALAGNDRSVQLKLPLETNTILMAPSGSDDHLNTVFAQPSDPLGILFANRFIGAKKRAVQVDRG